MSARPGCLIANPTEGACPIEAMAASECKAASDLLLMRKRSNIGLAGLAELSCWGALSQVSIMPNGLVSSLQAASTGSGHWPHLACLGEELFPQYLPYMPNGLVASYRRSAHTGAGH
eukprot:gene31412-6580_t